MFASGRFRYGTPVDRPYNAEPQNDSALRLIYRRLPVRVKSRWHNKAKTRTPQELGSTLAFIAWRIGMNAVKNMQKEGFDFPSYAVQLQVMEEFLPFLIQVVDRLVYERMDEETRRNLVTALALHLVDTMVENQV